MLHVTPLVFYAILQLIENHPVFLNHSNHAQTAVEQQLAVTLYQMGHCGNAASVEDVACLAGCGEGLVINYTDWCFTAIEKRWMDENIGFRGKWRNGWLMYDGTIVVLFQKPGLNRDAYYTQKGNYGLNVQV